MGWVALSVIINIRRPLYDVWVGCVHEYIWGYRGFNRGLYLTVSSLNSFSTPNGRHGSLADPLKSTIVLHVFYAATVISWSVIFRLNQQLASSCNIVDNMSNNNNTPEDITVIHPG
jgi:hypothetical protein